jgi:hypothetical protein
MGRMAEKNSGVELGLALLGRARNPEAVASAVGMLADSADPRIRQVINQKYGWISAEPRRRDQGCFQRAALVRALRGRGTTDDVPMLEQALWTIEISGRFDLANELRAAALVTLNEIDGRLASFHATRLLRDAHEMSGEPAVTAAKLLAQRDEMLPLYAAALQGGTSAEALAESLRGLTTIPESLVVRLVEQYRQEKDDAVVIGLFDLLLGHRSRARFSHLVAAFLDGAKSIDLYRFYVNAIVATRDPALVALLRRPDGPAKDSPKGKVLEEALALMPG